MVKRDGYLLFVFAVIKVDRSKQYPVINKMGGFHFPLLIEKVGLDPPPPLLFNVPCGMTREALGLCQHAIT